MNQKEKALREKHKKSEREASKAKELYRILAETSPDCIKLFDLQGKLLYINPSGLKEHRFKSLNEALGWDCLESLVPEDQEKFKTAFKEALAGKITTIEVRHLQEESTRSACMETIAPVKDPEGKMIYVFGVSRDISERKQIEESQHLAQLGELVAKMAHEVNNPLTIILGNAQQALMEGVQDQNIERVLNTIVEQCGRSRDVIQRLLTFSKPSKREKKRVNINETLDFIIKLIEHQFEINNIHIRKIYSPSLPYVKVDEKQMEEVFMNLLNNAADAMPKGGVLTITTLKEEKHVRIDFKDSGTGIPKEILNKIFNPFFTTKEKGTGLGLAVCQSILQSHGGELKYSSLLNQGTTAMILLPIVKSISNK